MPERLNAWSKPVSPRNQKPCSCPGRVPEPVSRRELLKTSATGFGMLALSALMADEAYAGLVNKPTGKPHHAQKAKNVIFLFMDGGVSHVDSYDPKPKLRELDGKEH